MSSRPVHVGRTPFQLFWCLGLLACGESASITVSPAEDSAPSLADAEIHHVSGDLQEGEVGQVLQNPLVIEVLDSNGSPYPGASVAFEFTDGAGSLLDAESPTEVVGTTTDPTGRASVQWQLGTTAGSQHATATIAIPGAATSTSDEQTASGRSVSLEAVAEAGPAAAVEVAPDATTLLLGDSVQLAASVSDQYGNALGEAVVQWTSSDADVAQVTASGLVRALVSGSASITAESGGAEGVATVAVTELDNVPPTAEIDAPGQDTTIILGDALILLGSAADVDGSVTSHRWIYGDGATASIEDPGSHTYASAGSYGLSYRVWDDGGVRSSVARRTVVVVETPPPPPTLSSVIISPSSATVEAGGTRQFSASGELSDGSPTAVVVDYTATGGAVSSAGAYTAGGSAGTYEVIATEPLSGLADTASVTVTTAPPGGYTELYRLDSFAGQNLSQIFSDRSGGDGTQSVVGDWLRQTIPPGASGGWADMFLDGNNGRPNEISSGTVRWSARVRLSPNWGGKGRMLFVGGTPPGDYFAYAGAAGQCPADGNGGNADRQFFIVRGVFHETLTGHPLRFYDQFVSQTGTVLGNCFGVGGLGGGYGTATFHGGDFFPAGGADFVLTLEVRLNTPGEENGHHRIYVDGALRAEFPNINFRNAGSNVVVSAVGLKPFISSGGNPVGSTVYIEFSQMLLEHDPSATPSPPR